MSNKIVDAEMLDSGLTAIADSIRAKTGEQGALAFPDGFVAAVNGIEQGGDTYKDIYDIITHGGTNFEHLFEVSDSYGNKLTELPWLDTSKGTHFKRMCYYSRNITSVPFYDLSNAIDLSEIFRYCEYVTEFPVFNIPNAKNIQSMFAECFRMEALPAIDTSKVERLNGLASRCDELTVVPSSISTASAVYANDMFYQCKSIVELGTFDFSKLTGATQNIFYGCTSLETIDKLIFGENITKIIYWFYDCKVLANVGVEGVIPCSIELKRCPLLTVTSAKNFLLALKNYAGTDQEFVNSITFHDTTKELLEAEGATAPDGMTWLEYADFKGWNT